MKLFIMRHGEAEAFATSDKARQLTDRGRLQVEAKAQLVKKRLSDVNIILHSPYNRAIETARIMADVFDITMLTELPQWTPESEPKLAISSLEGFVEHTPLIVTHMPLISYVEAILCDGSISNPASFNCAEIVEIETEWPATGLAHNCARF